MHLMDVHAAYGVQPGQHPRQRHRLAELLADLDAAGIAQALVEHHQARCYEPMHGNRRLVHDLAPHRPRLQPCWAVAPPGLDGAFDLPAFEAGMREHRVPAVRLLHRSWAVPEVGLWQPVLAALDRLPWPVLIKLPMPETRDLQEADRLLELLAPRPVVLTDVDWSQDRGVMWLMHRHTHLYIEFSQFQVNRGLEAYAEQFGASRLLFGTGLLERSAGAARLMVDQAQLPAEQRAAIGGGNLLRLLGLSPAPVVLPRPDRLVAPTQAGGPVEIPVIDAHAHVLHDGAHSAGGPFIMRRGDAAGMIELYEHMGVNAVAWMSWNGAPCMDAEAGNRITRCAIEQFPSRSIGLIHVNPAAQTPREIAETFAAYPPSQRFLGLKPYHRSPVPYDDARYEPFWEHGHGHKLYALLHTMNSTGGDPAAARIARRFDQMQVLIAHVGARWDIAERFVNVFGELPHVHAELTNTAVVNGIVEYLVEQVGPERVIFGSDAPMRDPRPQLGWVLYARLPEPQRRAVLADNIRRIIRRACEANGVRLPRGFAVAAPVVESHTPLSYRPQHALTGTRPAGGRSW